ncbi:MAG: polysaccharide deacetylase family protein [Acidimicrobiia bacterium]
MDDEHRADAARFGRRSFLAAAGLAAAAVVVSACGGDDSSATGTSTTGGTGTSIPPTTPATTPVTQATQTTQASGPAKFVSSGPTGTKQVALTFHTDGDLGLAQQLLDALAAGKAKGTMFIVGSWLAANQSWAKHIQDAGHELANHTYNHLSFETLSSQQKLDEIERCRDLLVQLTGTGGTFFRPSGTDDGVTSPSADTLDAAGTAEYRYVLGYDVDPLDYQNPGSDAVASRVLDKVKAGSIVSLHFNHPGTIAALPTILSGLQQRGLEPVTASTLLAIP